MIAFISDIHANLEALCSVFRDIDAHKIKKIICLGDIVGYGPDPEACTDMIMERADLALMGNHDYALLEGPLGFNRMAAEVIRITRAIMLPGEKPTIKTPDSLPCSKDGENPKCMLKRHSSPARWKFIQNLTESWKNKDFLAVHASPLDPVFEYVIPDKYPGAWKPDRIMEMFGSVDRLAFCGHTHLPCVISSDLTCVYPEDLDYRFTFEKDMKYIINVGSVGQPRDRDNRACYLLYDTKEDRIEWRRIEYDIEAVVKKSDAMCGEGNWCGERLRYGR